MPPRRTKSGRVDGRTTRYPHKHGPEYMSELEASYQVYLLASADLAVFFEVERMRRAAMRWTAILSALKG